MEREPVSLAILDIMLPEMDGFTLCKEIRQEYHFPIIMLTAKVEDYDKITGLTIGADDYITKPFNPLEVIARVKAQLRRYTKYNEKIGKENEDILEFSGLSINNTTHECILYGKDLSLTPIEFSILWLLASNRGKVISSEELFEQVWGDKTTWSLEQQYEYAHFEIEIGLSGQTVAALPAAEDLSHDEARRLVQAKLYAELAQEKDTSIIDLGSYHESVHFWRYPDDGGAWVFEYYGEDRKTPEFTGTLYQDTGNISIDIHDKNDLRVLYQSHCALHHFQTFRWWELDEQYAFYTLVVSLQQRQIEKYGELPAFAKQILEHQHVLPTDQMIGAEAAMEIAWNHLEPSAEQKAYVTLYQDSEDRIVYEVGFDLSSTESIRVLIDAFSAEVYDESRLSDGKEAHQRAQKAGADAQRPGR